MIWSVNSRRKSRLALPSSLIGVACSEIIGIIGILLWIVLLFEPAQVEILGLAFRSQSLILLVALRQESYRHPRQWRVSFHRAWSASFE
jgi:hypothetical protein